MRKLFVLGAALAMATNAFAAAGVANVTQKGSLMIAPDIRVDGQWNTLVRIQNDGSLGVDVICYWLDGNKNRVDFMFPITKNQAVAFDAKHGRGTINVNPFVDTVANGFPYGNWMLGTGITKPSSTSNPPNGFPVGEYEKGALICFAAREDSVSADQAGAQGQRQVKWNHLSMTVTVFNPEYGAYEYNAYAFNSPSLAGDLNPVGTAGELKLNGVDYDACPLYLIGQFSPAYSEFEYKSGGFEVHSNRLAVIGCNIDLRQDWTPTYTKIVFDIWNSEEIKVTGAFECADTWHELKLSDKDDIDSAGDNFSLWNVQTKAARYRAQGTASTQCATLFPNQLPAIGTTVAVGLLGVQSSRVEFEVENRSDETERTELVGSSLAVAGKFTTNSVKWNAREAVPEAR